MNTIIACLSCQSLAKIQSRRIPNLPSELCKDASVLWTVTFYLLVAFPSSLEMTAFFFRAKLGRGLLFRNVCICICFVLGCGRLPSPQPRVSPSSSRPSCHITRRNTPLFLPAQWCLLVRIQISLFSYCASLSYFLNLRNSRG
jgi:hypothetical protein